MATQTADQPAFHTDNITAHPGSTWAGAGVFATAIGAQIAQGSMPTTLTGWVLFLAQLLFAVAAALGK